MLDKLGDTPGIVAAAPDVVGVPRTPQEQRELLTQRPPAWEFLFYASVLLQRRAALEGKWRDHEIRYAPRNGKRIDRPDIVEYLTSAMDEMTAIVEGPNRVLDSDAQDLAFGAPGESGNPERIEHLATRVIGLYEELLDWAGDLRGVGVSDRFRNTFELAARLVELPLRQIHEIVDSYAAQVEQIPEKLIRGEPVHMEITLKLDMDPDALTAFISSLEGLKSAIASE